MNIFGARAAVALALVVTLVLVVLELRHRRADDEGSGSVRSSSDYGDKVEIGDTGYLWAVSGGMIPIFNSQTAMSNYYSLRRGGVEMTPLLVLEMIACVVPEDTKVLNITGQISGAFMSGSGGTRDVLVIEGTRAGCRGVVDKKVIHRLTAKEGGAA